MEMNDIYERSNNLHTYDMFIKENMLYFFDVYTNALCSLNLDAGCKYIGLEYFDKKITFPKLSKLKFVTGMYLINNLWIFSLRCGSTELLVLDISKNEIISKEIINNKGYLISFKHDEIFEHGNRVYIVSQNFMIIKTDIGLNQAEIIYKNAFYVDGKIPHGQLCLKDNQVYIPINNELYMFDMETENVVMIELNLPKQRKIESFVYGEHNFWGNTNDGRLFMWDGRNLQYVFDISIGQIILSEEMKQKISEEECRKFIRGYIFDKSLWFIPAYTDSIMKINLMTFETKIVKIEGEEENFETLNCSKTRKSIQKYVSFIQNDKMIYLMSSKTERLYAINMASSEVSRIENKWDIAYNDFLTLQNKFLFSEGMFRYTLKKYLRGICE
jgi:hypothetical protein